MWDIHNTDTVSEDLIHPFWKARKGKTCRKTPGMESSHLNLANYLAQSWSFMHLKFAVHKCARILGIRALSSCFHSGDKWAHQQLLAELVPSNFFFSDHCQYETLICLWYSTQEKIRKTICIYQFFFVSPSFLLKHCRCN